jgi:hypothetical protein
MLLAIAQSDPRPKKFAAPHRLPRLERQNSSRALHTGHFFCSAVYIARLLEML